MKNIKVDKTRRKQVVPKHQIQKLSKQICKYVYRNNYKYVITKYFNARHTGKTLVATN